MNNPTFFLEGILKNKEDSEDFSGPLSLILMLLTKNKIEIRDIQISLILEQYLEHIAQMKENNLEVASDFVQMASQLVYIKTKMLLTNDEEISELEQLMTSLEMLKSKDALVTIKTVVPQLSVASEIGSLMFPSPPEPISEFGKYEYKHECVDLFKAFKKILVRGTKVSKKEEFSPFVPSKIVYGVREKSLELINILRANEDIDLTELYYACKSRSEIVATFVSVLELCSGGCVEVLHDGDRHFIKFTGVETDFLKRIEELD